MLNKTVGIDAGGTYMKFGSFNGEFESKVLPFSKDDVEGITRNFDRVLATGAGSNTIKNWFPDKNIEVINEFQAAGLGGAYLSKKNECIVVNIGSGTPIIYANLNTKKVEHLGGTGLGSASLVGLAHFIAGVDNLTEIGNLALKGNPDNVNLLVGDLYKNTQLIGLPSDITASNFGKYQDWRQHKKPDIYDLLAGLHVMVGESIAVIANQTSKSYANDVPIVLTGGGTLNKALINALKKTFSFLNKQCFIPINAMYATLHGLFIMDNVI